VQFYVRIFQSSVCLTSPAVACSFKKSMIAFSVLSPSKSIGFYLSLAGQNLIVGKPWIGTPSTSLAVASIFPITILGEAVFNFSATDSYIGVNYLQCPHQGA